jgi:DnaJ-class molecular chaperone
MMDDRLDLLDYYTLFEIESDASADDVRHAFHGFARRFHPDNHVGATDEKRARAAQIYRRGAEAYRVLRDPVTRREYDAQLARGQVRYRPDGGTEGEGRRASGPKSIPAPKARPFFAEAQQALRAGDVRRARLNLQIALSHDPENHDIKELLARTNEQGA